MTETETEPRTVAVRRLETEIVAGDGRTVSFRIAPFGEIAESADGLGGLPKGQVYREELMPGLYDRQTNAANRIYLNFEHQQGIAGIVGHGLELERRPDGYHASFRIHETPEGDKTLLLVKEGVLRGASVESYWLKSVRSATGVIQRVRAHLEAVAVCREGAYPGAVLTGLRTGEQIEIGDEFIDLILDQSLLPQQFDASLAERIRALGHTVPTSLSAHPDGTPADAGTPESAPAPTETETETE